MGAWLILVIIPALVLVAAVVGYLATGEPAPEGTSTGEGES